MMNIIVILFYFFIGVILYSYVGYGIVLFILVKINRIFNRKRGSVIGENYKPEVTLLVAAYNEKNYVQDKIDNSRLLQYENLKQVWVTDGSDDGTPEILAAYSDVIVFHQKERRGKINAMNRAVKLISSPIIVFSDANTELSKDSIQRIVNLFKDPKVGCVSGEKRIFTNQSDDAVASGEGIYWKYESLLKKWDAELNTAVGAAGELFAVRKELYEEVEKDTILDDFIISLRIAMKGYKIQYDPKAYAIERASANVKEELKRKIRISAGGIQSVIRLYPLLNIFKFGMLSFQYISHRVLRWTLAPLGLILVLIFNILLYKENLFYQIIFFIQVGFYVFAILGWILENRKIHLKLLFVPYYFLVMNYAVYRGVFRFIQKNQSVNWERAKRSY